MYFNNVHILVYVGIAILGIIVGKIVAWANMRIPEKKKVFSKDFFEINKVGLENNYLIMIIVAVIYIALLYKFGLEKEVLKNLELIKYLILTPMIISAFFIDIKHRIIPNRINLIIFESGLIITFLYGITNINMANDMLLGMIVGMAIFLVIALLGRLFSGKEAMGFGDIKFMGALGLYFGVSKILEIALASFFISAIISIIILFIRIVIIKSKDEYIPFGPFLIIAAFLSMFLPTNAIFSMFIGICIGFSNKIIEVMN